jgi:iron complex outermembrane receptor protein
VTAGLRYTEEEQSVLAGNRAGATCNVPVADRIAGGCAALYSTSSDNWSYTAGVDWDATADVLLYAKTSRGFKGGGINQRGNLNGAFDAFQPEQVTDYEIGLKSEFWDRRARLNIAAYRSKYEDIQRTVLIPTPAGAVATAIQNAASATIDGVEAEFTVRPVPELTVQASGAYTSPKYDRYVVALTGEDRSNREFGAVPEWQGAFSATYEYPTRYGPLSGTLDVTYQSSLNYAPENNSPPSATLPQGTRPFTTLGDLTLVNGRIDLLVESMDLRIALWGRNLGDEQYYTNLGDYTSAGLGYVVGYISEPRTYGIEVTKRF